VLGDAARRAQYDRFGEGGPAPDVHTWSTGQGGPYGNVHVDFGGEDLTSIFEQFFSRGMGGMGGLGGTRTRRRTAVRPRTGPRGADLEHAVELSFDEAVHGAEREVTLASPDGTTERVRFRVPPGVNEGQRVRVPGKGQEGPAGRGDMLITTHVRPHPYFRLDGRDVLLDLDLSFAEAALGAQVEIPTLDGRTLVRVPVGTSCGTKLRLRGRGVRDPRSGAVGDLYALVRIVVPRELSPRARELIQELDRELKLRLRENLR
jgi:curved DNA-binding protein